MSGPASDGGAQGPTPHAKRPNDGVLVTPRRPITRYRPVVIAGAAGVVILVIGAAFIVGLGAPKSKSQADPPTAAQVSDDPTPVEARLPARYDDPVALPPPQHTLLGSQAPSGAALAAEGPSSSAPTPSAPSSPERDQARREVLAARASSPFFSGPGSGAVAARPAGGEPAATPAAGIAPVAPASPVAASAKEQFIAAAAARGPQAPILPRPPLSPYEVKAGALIPAALVTGINSDLPGPVIAQVTEPVFDHLTGRRVLIPQGARLIGRYDSAVGYGQERVLVVWTQLVFPSGRSVDLGAMVGLDAAGVSGLTGKTDRHLPVLARAIGLSTLIAIGGAAAQNSAGRPDDRVVLQDAAGGLAASASQTGQRLVDRDLQRPPTLRIAPGQRVRVLIDRDLILPPEIPPSP